MKQTTRIGRRSDNRNRSSTFSSRSSVPVSHFDLLCNRTLAICSKQKIVCTKVKSVYRNKHQLRQFTIKTSKDDLNLLSVFVSRTLTPKSKGLSNQGRALVCIFCKRFSWKSKEDTCLKSSLRASSLAGWDVGRENEVRACNDLSAI